MLASDLLETGMDIQFVVTSAMQGVNDHATAAGMHSSTELELLRGCQRGEAQSFEALVRQYSGRLLTVARRLLRNEEDARDAVQDAFLSAFRAFPYFRADAK